MSNNLSPEQIEKLQSLGVYINDTQKVGTYNLYSSIKFPKLVVTPTHSKIIPIFVVAGITLFSFGGIVLLKNQSDPQSKSATIAQANIASQENTVTPKPTTATQPIQSFLLLSQQYFSQALQLQTGQASNNDQVVNLLNQSIISASDAIKNYPTDYRGFYQRARIYQSLVDSKPELIDQALSDLSNANKINPNSAEVTRDLAALFARKGDAQNTLNYLNRTVSLEPTKAQNFYDLAKIQQQTGQVIEALNTYTRLLPLITDPVQLAQVQAEKVTLEQIVTQNPGIKNKPPINNFGQSPSTQPNLSFPDNPPKLQASTNTGLIIAAPESKRNIEINNVTNSNSLSGTATLPSNTKEISITNNNIKTTSQVYVTILKGGKNQTLQVLSKSENTFNVGFDSPISETVDFKWWIIN